MAPKELIERMPPNAQSRLVNFRMTEEELQEANLYAQETYRSRALFIRLMYLRGLGDYKMALAED
ncbi:MAG: hypothetical protein GAK35_04308 [Herbaspirillum frisingense]|uniref:Uncharacterized protein n=1 Tax=Herbaspirillum frisingense TaxID=92645 RepID=A0A7V8FSM3_9BURK|nr:MAG: hypothetical protein GAK35_04308 [Herbaspirillum frisingense]